MLDANDTEEKLQDNHFKDYEESVSNQDQEFKKPRNMMVHELNNSFLNQSMMNTTESSSVMKKVSYGRGGRKIVAALAAQATETSEVIQEKEEEIKSERPRHPQIVEYIPSA